MGARRPTTPPRPFSGPKYDRNSDRAGADMPCAICGKGIRENSQDLCGWAQVVDGGARFARLDETVTQDGGYMGWHPVGPTCARKFPPGYLQTPQEYAKTQGAASVEEGMATPWHVALPPGQALGDTMDSRDVLQRGLRWLDATLQGLLARPRMYGSMEAVELQALLLVEMRVQLRAPSWSEKEPRWVLEQWQQCIQRRYRGVGNSTLANYLSREQGDVGNLYDVLTECLARFAAAVHRSIDPQENS